MVQNIFGTTGRTLGAGVALCLVVASAASAQSRQTATPVRQNPNIDRPITNEAFDSTVIMLLQRLVAAYGPIADSNDRPNPYTRVEPFGEFIHSLPKRGTRGIDGGRGMHVSGVNRPAQRRGHERISRALPSRHRVRKAAPDECRVIEQTRIQDLPHGYPELRVEASLEFAAFIPRCRRGRGEREPRHEFVEIVDDLVRTLNCAGVRHEHRQRTARRNVTDRASVQTRNHGHRFVFDIFVVERPARLLAKMRMREQQQLHAAEFTRCSVICARDFTRSRASPRARAGTACPTGAAA